MHSLVTLLCLYSVRLNFVSPMSLAMPANVVSAARKAGVPVAQCSSLEEVPQDTDGVVRHADTKPDGTLSTGGLAHVSKVRHHEGETRHVSQPPRAPAADGNWSQFRKGYRVGTGRRRSFAGGYSFRVYFRIQNRLTMPTQNWGRVGQGSGIAPGWCYDFPRNPLFSSVSPCLPLWLTCHSSHLDTPEPPPHSLNPPESP